MTSSVSGQDQPNLALWLATRAGKKELSCPLWIRALSRNENLACFGVSSHMLPSFTMLVRCQDGWILAHFFFFFCVCVCVCVCVFMDFDFVSVYKHAKRELDQYPAILTTRLVNNPYITNRSRFRFSRQINVIESRTSAADVLEFRSAVNPKTLICVLEGVTHFVSCFFVWTFKSWMNKWMFVFM